MTLPVVLSAEDQYRNEQQTAYTIEIPASANPRDFMNQTLTLNGCEVRVRDVVDAFGSVQSDRQSVVLIVDRLNPESNSRAPRSDAEPLRTIVPIESL